MLEYNKPKEEIDEIVYNLLYEFNEEQQDKQLIELSGNDLGHVCCDIKRVVDKTRAYNKLYKKCLTYFEDILNKLGYDVC